MIKEKRVVGRYCWILPTPTLEPSNSSLVSKHTMLRTVISVSNLNGKREELHFSAVHFSTIILYGIRMYKYMFLLYKKHIAIRAS